jgi:hypothetical protein
MGFRALLAVAILGWTIAVVATALALLFYTDGRNREAEVAYAVHPLQHVVADTRRFPKIHVQLNGRDLPSTITRVNLLLWSKGAGESAVIVGTDQGHDVLDAKLIGSSPGFSIELESFEEKVLRIAWRTFPTDGWMIVSLLYSGPPGATFRLEAEGGVRVSEAYSPVGAIYQRPFPHPLRRALKIYVIGVVVVIILSIALVWMAKCAGMSNLLITWGITAAGFILVLILYNGMWRSYGEPPPGWDGGGAMHEQQSRGSQSQPLLRFRPLGR